MSVLEASRAAGIPHASVCGGRGRCSTCRVRVGAGAAQLPPPAADEARVLARIGDAGGGVRLACQLRPTHDLEVTPLMPAGAGPSDIRVQVNPGQGIEREIAVLFADLRAFTRMAEGRLPYDVVFVLNQYFRAMGQAIEEAGADGSTSSSATASWPCSGSSPLPRRPAGRRSPARRRWRARWSSSTGSSSTTCASRCGWASASTWAR